MNIAIRSNNFECCNCLSFVSENVLIIFKQNKITIKFSNYFLFFPFSEVFLRQNMIFMNSNNKADHDCIDIKIWL